MVRNGRELLASVITGTILTLTLYFSYRTLPVIGALAVLLVPFPSIFYTLKTGRKAGYSIIAASVVILGVYEPEVVVTYLVQWLPMSLLLPEMLLRGKGFAQAIFIAVGIQMLMTVVMTGLLPASTADEEVRRIVDIALSPMGEKIELEKLRQIKEILTRIFPSCLVINSGIMALINLLVLRLFRVFRDRITVSARFADYRNPDALIWVLILSGFMLLIDNTAIQDIALNILILTLIMYLVQGLAVVTHFFGRSSLPRFIQPVFYLLLFIQPYLAAAVAACGIFDLWADFRNPRKQQNL